MANLVFFAPILGITSSAVEAEATAAFVPTMRGFRPPQSGSLDLPVLPFALDVRQWEELMQGNGQLVGLYKIAPVAVVFAAAGIKILIFEYEPDPFSCLPPANAWRL